MENNEAQKIVIECFKKNNKAPPKTYEFFKMSLQDIDDCIDCVSDILCNEGFNSYDEPTQYGLLLEHTIDYLLHFRYAIVDKTNYGQNT